MLVEQLRAPTSAETTSPKWVDNKNVSGRVWQAMLTLKSEKSRQIASHQDRNGMTRKRDYTISKKEIAARASCNPATLHNRTFSKAFDATLTDLNEQLRQEKDARIAELRKVGVKDRRKDELLAEIRNLTDELNTLKKQKTKTMVDDIFSRLPLKIRRALLLQ